MPGICALSWAPVDGLRRLVVLEFFGIGIVVGMAMREYIFTLLLMALASLIVAYYITLRVPFEFQLISSVVLLSAMWGLARYRPDLRLFLALISATVSLRYIVWRATHTLDFYNIGDTILGLILFAAECYGIIILLLGYFQTVQELRRVPIPLPSDPDALPWVDVFIPTYNEPPSLVGRTAMGAMLMDYPRKRVYILDDNRRAEMRALADKLGCGYLTRADNKHAKAGNINEALKRTSGEFVAIFDADHVPVRSFLQMTVGFFLKDPRVALVQTPHHFFNPDPFQRNLLTDGKVPAEQELFYHVILVGNDFWNSAFFCGSCALLRRSALLGVGGIAQETVTEDAHTALKLHARGWHSAYLPIPQAAGLATERYAFHVKQRMRWAQGMVQILRLDNPLFKKGLTLPQRLNYLNAMIHFLFGIPRLVYVLAPLTYLLFGARPLRGDPWEILAYALPHVAMAIIATSLINRGFRHAFWAEVYEMSISWQSAVVTTMTLFSPKNASFNVTTKGDEFLERAEFDWRNARPNLVLLGLSISGLLVAPMRYWYAPMEGGTILLNSLWTLLNLVILSAAVLVALEQKQTRRSYRIARGLKGLAVLEDGSEVALETDDISELGCRARLPGQTTPVALRGLVLFGSHGLRVETNAEVVYQRVREDGVVLGIRFEDLVEAQRMGLIQLIYTAADSWIGFETPGEGGLGGFWEVVKAPFRVLSNLLRGRQDEQNQVAS